MIIGGTRVPVGRDRELADLDAWAQMGLAGTGAALVVSGDAGIGKTTLLQHFAGRLQADGVLVTLGHCVDLGGSPLPYLPFAEAFDRLRTALPDRLPALLERRPALGRLLTTDGTGESAGSQMELFEAVRGGLEELAADSGLLVWIEDVHWADQSSLDLISYLFTRGFAGPVLLAVSYRTDDLHRRHPLRRVLAQWSRLAVRRLDLRPLDPDAVRSLVGALADGPRDAELVRRVVERAEGNAFYAEELAIAAGDHQGGRPGLPADLSDLLLFRINALGAASRAVVRAASVGGRRVRHDVLAEVVGLDADALSEALREALDGQVLQTDDDGYLFRHALLAEAVAADLLPGERVRLHAGYVRALRSAGSGSASDLARHALAAGDDDTALVASVEAGREALAVGGPEEALAHLEAALALLDRGHADAGLLPADLDEVEIARSASAAAQAAGLAQRAIALVRDRLEALPSDADPLSRARLLEAMAASVNLSDYEEPIGFAAEALGLVPDEPTVLRARVLLTYATSLAGRGRYAEALRWGEEARTRARDVDQLSLAADAATLMARMRVWVGDARSSRDELRTVIAEARQRDDPAEIKAAYLLAMHHYEAGELPAALDLFEAAADRSRDLGRPWAPYGVDGRAMAAITEYALGHWDRALELTSLADEPAPGLAAGMLRAAAMSVLVGRGDTEALVGERQLRDWWRGDGVIAVLTTAAGIDAYGDSGDIDAAAAVHDQGVDFLTEAWFDRDFAANTRLAALLLGQLATAARPGSPARPGAELLERAPALLEHGERAFAQADGRRRQGPESRAWLHRLRAEAARLRWTSGAAEPEDSLLSAWRAAVDGFSAFPHAFERARSQARLAAVLVAVGDRAEARRLAGAAREVATALRARPLLGELEALGLAGSRSPDVLTPREAEVMALVSEGLSNAEVGRRLVISTKTASVHVSNILAKLGAQSRTEAVTLARRRGLLP